MKMEDITMSMKDKYSDIVTEAFDEIKSENNKLKHVNLLVAGKSGVGKSTLINTVFGEELAKTGVGKPVTDKIQLIEKKGFPVRIYDTVGFELSKQGFDISGLIKSMGGNDIKKLIKKVKHTVTVDDDIHVVWYLISGTSSRFEKAELAFINWLVSQGLPVIVVLTKSYDKTEASLLQNEINKMAKEIKGTVMVLAEKTDHIEAFGIETLISKTFDVLPEGLQASFVHSQEASIELKHSQAVKVINTSMAATFTTGFSPIVGTDAPLMMATQTKMLGKITSVYGVDVSKQHVETALAGVLGVAGAMVAGKSLAGNLAKLMPGLGTVGGGLISGGVGMIITGALGYAYAELMELVLAGKVDLSSITPEELTDLLIHLMPKFMPKAH